VAAMSLSVREQQALDGIADDLAGSAPKLAAMLAMFTRLTSDEGMPTGERVIAIRPDADRVRRLFRCPGVHCAMPLLWVLIAVALIAVAVAASRGSEPGCVKAWAMTCGNPTLTNSARPVHNGAASHPPPVTRPVPYRPPVAPSPDLHIGQTTSPISVYRGTI
jgi:hypothetical protein